MQYDIFFSISQTPAGDELLPEVDMFRNFFHQVEAADRLGFDTAWIAESHLSSEVQKRHKRPVIPHWKGEVGLNVDVLQLAHRIFQRTERIEVGSAITNIMCMGGPIAHAERLAYFATLHGLDSGERRRLHLGMAAGRFDFMNSASGVLPRTPAEVAAGRAWKGAVFSEAAEIFCRLLRGDVLESSDISPRTLSRESFRSDEDWARIQQAAETEADEIPVTRQWEFEPVKIIPQDWRRDLVQLVIGSHDPATQEMVNEFLPVNVFNLSITQPDMIEATHQRMTQAYHPDGGVWQRQNMPRTVFVFLNHEEGLTPEERSAAAHDESREALGAYWTALEGTLDPGKVERAANNALVGNAEEIAAQARDRFHPDDRLMLWFDFFNHDSDRVVRNMEAFMTEVVPRLEGDAAS